MEIGESSKRLISDTHQQDFISALPDSLLVHILSFMPTHDAIKTVLLRRFGNLWRSVPVLDFNACLYHRCASDKDDYKTCLNFGAINIPASIKFTNRLHRVSDLHDVGTLDKLVFRFYFVICKSLRDCDPTLYDHARSEWEKATTRLINKLVAYAMNRNVKVLDLNFGACVGIYLREFHALRSDVFRRSNYLTDMSLIGCNIEPCTDISLNALRVLRLDRVLLSDDVMEKIVLSSPFLEDLSLINCYGLSKLYCRSPNFKRLTLTLNSNIQKTALNVSCPHVTSLEIFRWLVGATLVDVVFSPVEATLSFEQFFRPFPRVYDVVARLLHMISLCKSITLCGYVILMMTEWNFTDVPCASYQWKKLNVNVNHLDKLHHPGLFWLLKSCQSLETLTMHIGPPIRKLEEQRVLKEGSVLLSHHCDPKSCWDLLQENEFTCLECVTISGHVNEPFVDQMLKFLLKNAPKLQKMVILIEFDGGSGKYERSSCQVLKLVQELSEFPRASSQAVICLSS